MRTLHPATVVAILLVALVLNIYILVGMHRKECSIIEARNYGTVKEGSFATWTGVINFFSELHDVTPKALQPLHLSPTKSVHKKLVIGIPFAPERTRYISGTLSSLFDKLDEDYRNDVMVLLMIASNETDTENFREKTAWIQGNFSKEIESGLMKVIAVPKAWYRIAVRSVPPTFGDSLERMYWRTKQNIDYIYIMTYASQMCDYYLQLEDDVVAADGYIRVIFNYLTFKSDSSWFLISFTTIGFIGKLFRSTDLKYMSYAIALYHRFKPVDWILWDLLTGRYCDPGKSPQDCAQKKHHYEITSGSPQFRHVGRISSLKGKTNPSQHDHFGTGDTQGKRGNPAAKVTSSMSTKEFHDAQFGYDNYFVMWFLNATSGDYVSVAFHDEILLTGVMFMSGLPPVPQYKLGPETVVYAINKASEKIELGRFSFKGDFLLRRKGIPVTELRIELTAFLLHEIVIDHILIDTQ